MAVNGVGNPRNAVSELEKISAFKGLAIEIDSHPDAQRDGRIEGERDLAVIDRAIAALEQHDKGSPKLQALRELRDVARGAKPREPAKTGRLWEIVQRTQRAEAEVVLKRQGEVQRLITAEGDPATIEKEKVALSARAQDHFAPLVRKVDLKDIRAAVDGDLRAVEAFVFLWRLIENKPKLGLSEPERFDLINKVIEKVPEEERDALARLALLTEKQGVGLARTLRDDIALSPASAATAAGNTPARAFAYRYIQPYFICARPPREVDLKKVLELYTRDPDYPRFARVEHRVHLLRTLFAYMSQEPTAATLAALAIGDFKAVFKEIIQDTESTQDLLARTAVRLFESTPQANLAELTEALAPTLGFMASHPAMLAKVTLSDGREVVARDRVFDIMRPYYGKAQSGRMYDVITGAREPDRSFKSSETKDLQIRQAAAIFSEFVVEHGGYQAGGIEFLRHNDPNSPAIVYLSKWPEGEKMQLGMITPADGENVEQFLRKLGDLGRATLFKAAGITSAKEQRALLKKLEGAPPWLLSFTSRDVKIGDIEMVAAAAGEPPKVRLAPETLASIMPRDGRIKGAKDALSVRQGLVGFLADRGFPQRIIDSVVLDNGKFVMDLACLEVIQRSRLFSLAMRHVRFSPEAGSLGNVDEHGDSLYRARNDAGWQFASDVVRKGEPQEGRFRFAEFNGNAFNPIRWVEDGKGGGGVKFVLPALAYSRFDNVVPDPTSDDKDRDLSTADIGNALKRYFNEVAGVPAEITVLKDQVIGAKADRGGRERVTDMIAVDPRLGWTLIDGSILQINTEGGVDDAKSIYTLVSLAANVYETDPENISAWLAQHPSANQYSVSMVNRRSTTGRTGGAKLLVMSLGDASQGRPAEYIVAARGTAGLADGWTDLVFPKTALDFASPIIPADELGPNPRGMKTLAEVLGFSPEELPQQPGKWPALKDGTTRQAVLEARFGHDFDFVALRELVEKVRFHKGFLTSALHVIDQVKSDLLRAEAMHRLRQPKSAGGLDWIESQISAAFNVWQQNPKDAPPEFQEAMASIKVKPEDMPPINYTGHSKGGGEISVVALMLTLAGFKMARKVTIGEPPPMDEYGILLQRLLQISPKSIPIRLGNDVVTVATLNLPSADGKRQNILKHLGNVRDYSNIGYLQLTKMYGLVSAGLSHSSLGYRNYAMAASRAPEATPETVPTTRIDWDASPWSWTQVQQWVQQRSARALRLAVPFAGRPELAPLPVGKGVGFAHGQAFVGQLLANLSNKGETTARLGGAEVVEMQADYGLAVRELARSNPAELAPMVRVSASTFDHLFYMAFDRSFGAPWNEAGIWRLQRLEATVLSRAAEALEGAGDAKSLKDLAVWSRDRIQALERQLEAARGAPGTEPSLIAAWSERLEHYRQFAKALPARGH